MDWMRLRQSPEQLLAIELQARNYTEREAMLYRSLCMYQQLLAQATWEITRLELLVEEQRMP